jgi:hypothetical protein
MTRKIIPLPPQNVLHALLDYSPTTGVFTWRKSNGTAAAGREAGWLHKAGYVYIGLGGRNYKAHRLAWMYVYGVDPAGLLDHRDRDKTNNRIANLRVCTQQLNAQNYGPQKNNTSGYRCVFLCRKTNRWMVKMALNGKRKYLGTYATPEEADKVARAASLAAYGEFSYANL